MDYQECLDSAVTRLRSLGIEVEVKQSARLSAVQLTELEEAAGAQLAVSAARFCCEFSDGLILRWRSEDSPCVFGKVEIPGAQGLLEFYRRYWVDHLIDLHVKLRQQGEVPETDSVQLGRMRAWLPFLCESDGSMVLLDSGGEKEVVRLGRLNPQTEEGQFMAPSLEDFFSHWSRACFQSPLDSNWARVIDSKGVRWRDPALFCYYE